MLSATRTLGAKSALCTEPQSIGRLVIGVHPCPRQFDRLLTAQQPPRNKDVKVIGSGMRM